MNPLAYLLIALLGTSLVLMVMLLEAWRSFGRHPHALAWAAAFGCGTVQWCANLAVGVVPHWLYWAVASGAGLAVATFALIGFRLRCSQRPLFLPLALTWAVMLLLCVLFNSVVPHVGLRLFIAPAHAAVVLAWCTILIYRYRSTPRRAEWLAIVVFGTLCVLQIASATTGLMTGREGDPDMVNIYRQVNFLGMPSAYVAAGLTTVFLLASDLSESMKRLARTDQLTGLLNRRGFEAAVDQIVSKQPDSYLGLLDVDHFKVVNDTYGHATGDDALRAISDRLRRREGIAGRLGGEEFGVVYSAPTKERALSIAEDLRKTIEAESLELPNGALTVTASIGVTSFQSRTETLYRALQRADKAMYRAKKSGRNRVEYV